MKKIIFGICFVFFAFCGVCFADEIVDSQGNIIPCKIETVSGGLVEYKKDGNLYSFARVSNQVIFNDYVDVQTKFFKDPVVQRYSGTIIAKDACGVRIRNNGQDMEIPWYRVKFVGIYKP